MKQPRPMISTYEQDENGVERLVRREMNAAEFKQWKSDVKDSGERRKADEARPHPLIEQLRSMSDEEIAELKRLLA